MNRPKYAHNIVAFPRPDRRAKLVTVANLLEGLGFLIWFAGCFAAWVYFNS